ncbi:hypothetical protein NUW54_g6760 [Trametes sanguinea]|uniref:Uncharacterized protein n=1 Tax=Trametes sanguinea TaxID=158606 RepID=A0ACC1PRG0_9APHY|nr:hypothetical protein NUW54_g6760 [Trametes sanguinea]
MQTATAAPAMSEQTPTTTTVPRPQADLMSPLDAAEPTTKEPTPEPTPDESTPDSMDTTSTLVPEANQVLTTTTDATMRPETMPVPTRTALASSEVPTTAATALTVFNVGNPLDALKDKLAPPLPSLITPAMAALVTAATMPSQAITNDADPISLSTPETHIKKAARQRVTTSRTARNLYAFVYMREHPAATTEEFNAAFKALSEDVVQQFNAIHAFAVTQPSKATLDAIIQAFHALEAQERLEYEEIAKNARAKQVGKGSGGKPRGKAKSLYQSQQTAERSSPSDGVEDDVPGPEDTRRSHRCL